MLSAAQGLVEARQELRPSLVRDQERLKDVVFLDLALDSTARTAVERGMEYATTAQVRKHSKVLSTQYIQCRVDLALDSTAGTAVERGMEYATTAQVSRPGYPATCPCSFHRHLSVPFQLTPFLPRSSSTCPPPFNFRPSSLLWTVQHDTVLFLAWLLGAQEILSSTYPPWCGLSCTVVLCTVSHLVAWRAGNHVHGVPAAGERGTVGR